MHGNRRKISDVNEGFRGERRGGHAYDARPAVTSTQQVIMGR